MCKKNSFVLSVCIPTWNRADVLKKTLEALTGSQSFRKGKVQIVISDNASDDDTGCIGRQFARDFAGKIEYWRHENGIDPHFNFKHALEMGTGEFVKLHVDYIYYVPGELDKIVAEIEKIEKEHGVILWGNSPGKEIKVVDSLDDILHEVSFYITSINNLCLRRKLYQTLEDPFRKWYTYFPQVDILLRLMECGGKAVILPEVHTVRQSVLNQRNHTMIFSNYLDMLEECVSSGRLSRRAFGKQKKSLLFGYLIPYHFDFFHQYNVSRKPLPFLPHCKHFKKEWYFLSALAWIGVMWICSNIIPIHQFAGKIKRKLFQ